MIVTRNVSTVSLTPVFAPVCCTSSNPLAGMEAHSHLKKKCLAELCIITN